MSAKRKKEAPAPAREEAGNDPGSQDSTARIAPLDSAELPAGLVWTMPESAPTVPLAPTRATDDAANEKKSLSAPAQELVPTRATPAEMWADPWAAAKAAGFLVERVVQKCQSSGARRAPNGIWKVTPEVLVALGAPADRAAAAVEAAKAQTSLEDGRTEGAVVYALSGPGRVAVRSLAERPRNTRTLAWVREPSRLRCGDEVAIRYTESGRAEVVHGR